MKNQILATLLLFIPSLSYAVRVADCPDKIKVSLSDFQVISASQLEKQLSVFDNEAGDHERLRSALEKLGEIDIEATLDKGKSSGARCSYLIESSVGFGRNDDFVFATSKGKDWIRFRLHGKDGIIGGYINVTSYSKDGIETTNSVPMGLDDGNHPGFINPILARAKSVDVK